MRLRISSALGTYFEASSMEIEMRSLCICTSAAVLYLYGPSVDAASFAYIPNTGDNTVSVIDTATSRVVATVPVGSAPVGVAVNLAGTRVYVVNQGDRTLSLIDTANNSVALAQTSLGLIPFGIAVDSAGTRAYVSNSGSNNVSVLDTEAGFGVTFVGVGNYPVGIAVNTESARAYVANQGSNSVSVIDTAALTVIHTVPVGTAPFAVALNATGTRVYVTNRGESALDIDTVSVIDTATNAVVATVTVGDEPMSIAVNPAGTRVFVANARGNNLSVIDTATNTVVATVAAGGTNPNGVGVNSTGTRVFVANTSSNSVSVIDTATNTVTATEPVGAGPYALGLFISGAGANPTQLKLAFPVVGSAGPYDARISSYFDHSAGPYQKDGKIFLYTGDYGACMNASGEYLGMEITKVDGNKPQKKADLALCKQLSAGVLKNDKGYLYAYLGDRDNSATYPPGSYLYYDGHPGYDYPEGNFIRAAAGGTLCLATPNNNSSAERRAKCPYDTDDINATNVTDAWEWEHAFYIVHPDSGGLSTWYLHASSLGLDIDALIALQGYAEVAKGQTVATIGDFFYGKKGGVGRHLHFEVRRGSDSPVDPYGWDESPALWEQRP